MKAKVSRTECSKAICERGPNEIRKDEVRKKAMRHFYITDLVNEVSLVEKVEDTSLVLALIEPVPEGYYCTREPIYQADCKVYIAGCSIALKSVENDRANGDTD
jgi:hypothetical protein